MLARFTAFSGKKPSNKSGNIRKTNCDPVIHFTFPDQILPILAIATVAPENAPETKGIPQRLSNLWKVWLTCFCARKKKQRPTMYQSMSATHCLDCAHGPVISSLVVLIEQTRFPVVLQTSPLVFYILWMQTHSLHGLRCPVRTIVRVVRIKNFTAPQDTRWKWRKPLPHQARTILRTFFGSNYLPLIFVFCCFVILCPGWVIHGSFTLFLKSKGIDFRRPHLFWTRQAWHQITLKGLNPESCLANIANPSAQSNVRSMISKIVGSLENKVYAKQLFPEFNCYDMCSSQGQNKSWMWRQANPNRPWWGRPMAWQFFLTSPDASKAQVRISTALCNPQHPFSASSSASSSPQRGFKNSSV